MLLFLQLVPSYQSFLMHKKCLRNDTLSMKKQKKQLQVAIVLQYGTKD